MKLVFSAYINKFIVFGCSQFVESFFFPMIYNIVLKLSKVLCLWSDNWFEFSQKEKRNCVPKQFQGSSINLSSIVLFSKLY